MLLIKQLRATRVGSKRGRSMKILAAVAFAMGWAGLALAADNVRHEMTLDIDPASHQLKVTDRVKLPAELAAA